MIYINKKNTLVEGFTLIELLVVMMVIAILVSVSLFGLQGSREAARDGKRKADLETIRSGIELLRSDCGHYPIPATSGDFKARFGTTLTGNEGTCTVSSSNVYINNVPSDPTGSARNYYYTTDGSTYRICAGLENEVMVGADTTCGAVCGTGVTCTYYVTNP